MCGKWVGRHFISTKNPRNFGLTTYFFIDCDKFIRQNLTKFSITIMQEDNATESIKDLNKYKIDYLLTVCTTDSNLKGTSYSFYHQPFSNDSYINIGATVLNKKHKNYNFFIDGKKLLVLPVMVEDIPLKEIDREGRNDQHFHAKIQFYLDLMEKTFNLFECPFGFGDQYDIIEKVKVSDPRKEVFGINYYGREMVREIGRDRLLDAPECFPKETPWGGVILKLDLNPFCGVDEKRKLEVKKYLWG